MKIEKKLSDLSTVPERSLERFHYFINLIHSQDIVTQIVAGKKVFELEIFEGRLYIKLDDDDLKFKFVPNEEFIKLVKNSIKEKKSELVEAVTDRLKNTLLNTYKDVL